VAVLGVIGLGLEHVVGHTLPVHVIALLVLAAAAVAAGLLLYRLVEEPLLGAFHTRLFTTPLAAPREPQAKGWRADPEAAI
jgi:peptidoglycan/LPS O-acetylase OafA/YrhL